MFYNRIIFDILNLSASSERDILVESSFIVIQKIAAGNLAGLKDYLIDLLDVSLKFIKNKNEEIVKEALEVVAKIINIMNSIKYSKQIPQKDLENENIDAEDNLSIELALDLTKEKSENQNYYGISEGEI